MKWTYGDSLQAPLADESGNIVMKPCEVVGITVVENVPQSEAIGWPFATILYTVEFPDGSDALIPEAALLPLEAASA